MRTGFDAKRAFLNSSGLGNYSRYVINGLCEKYPANEYYLYTTGEGSFVPPSHSVVRKPSGFPGKQFPSYWRTFSLAADLERDRIELFHGLSNEIPRLPQKRNFRTVVTIHDLIFIRHPELYPFTDRSFYLWKTRYAVRHADHIIATSEQTRSDLIELIGAYPKKISVVYQSCDPRFGIPVSEDEKERIRQKYRLPGRFILSVGTVEERKNLLGIAEALRLGRIDIPVISAGRKTAYAAKTENFVRENKLHDFRLLGEVPSADLPAIYQMATIFIYPSFYEGFGIPVLEAISSGLPVITSAGGCLEESGGEGALFVDPHDPSQLSEAIRTLLNNEPLCSDLTAKGLLHAAEFSQEKTLAQLYKTYELCLT